MIMIMDLKEATCIRDIVNQNIEVTRVLEGLSIEYWNNCNLTLAEVAQKTGSNVETLIDDFKIHLRKRILDPWRLEELGFAELCMYMTNRHHCYAKETITFLDRKLQQSCNVHGSEYPELHKIVRLFREVAENLATHILEEERMIFPMIMDLNNATDKRIIEINENRIVTMLTDISNGLLKINNLFNEISHLSKSFSVPLRGDQTFSLACTTLKEFEHDHHLHIYVEKHVLLKKIKDLLTIA